MSPDLMAEFMARVSRRVPARSDLAPGMAPQPGNLIFWNGHVGIMPDPTRLLHSSGHHMAVSIETLDEVRTRVAIRGEGPIARHARLDATPPDD